MSAPVAGCWILAAARGDEDSYRKVLQAMRHELATGSRTLLPCSCQPLCPQPTPEQIAELHRRLQVDIREHQPPADR
jgi:hypothetical protein